jgi:hypothetical protein
MGFRFDQNDPRNHMIAEKQNSAGLLHELNKTISCDFVDRLSFNRAGAIRLGHLIM